MSFFSKAIDSGKLKRKDIFFVFTIIAALIFIAVSWFQSRDVEIVLRNTPLRVMVADNPKEMYRGLGKRESLAPYDGMIFLFPIPGRHGIVMRDMSFPIDIVWLSKGTVIDFAKNVPLEPGVENRDLTVYYPRVNATTVLELSAGWIDEHGLEIGDVISGVKK